MENLTACINYIEREEKIQLLNINSGNLNDQKNSLSLVWSLILKYQIKGSSNKNVSSKNDREDLKDWCNSLLAGSNVISNFKSGWKDGTALCQICNAVVHNSIDNNVIAQLEPLQRVDKAMGVLETNLGVERILEPEDFINVEKEDKLIITYISMIRSRYTAQQSSEENKEAVSDKITSTPTKKDLISEIGFREEPMTPTKSNFEGVTTPSKFNYDDELKSPSKRKLRLNIKDDLKPIEKVKKLPFNLKYDETNVNNRRERNTVNLSPSNIPEDSFSVDLYEFKAGESIDVFTEIMDEDVISKSSVVSIVLKRDDATSYQFNGRYANEGLSRDGFQFNITLEKIGTYSGYLQVLEYLLPTYVIFEVKPGDFCEANTKVTGFSEDGDTKWIVGMRQEITAILFDKFNNPIKNYERNAIKFSIGDGSNGLDFYGEPSEDPQNQILFKFEPKKLGNYHATLNFGTFSYQKNVQVVPGPVCPSKCQIQYANRQASIILRDSKDNRLLSTDGVDISVYIEISENVHIECPTKPVSGFKLCSTIPNELVCGDFELKVIINHVERSVKVSIPDSISGHVVNSVRLQSKEAKIFYPRCSEGNYQMYICRGKCYFGPYDVVVQSHEISDKLSNLKELLGDSYESVTHYLKQVPSDIQEKFIQDLYELLN